MAALSFSEPLHQPGAGIPADTDEMFDVRHLLSHGASWRTFDFLGFNVRRYRGKLLTKPSTAAQRRIRERLRTEMRSLRGANAGAVIKRLNPIIRGWAAYYRGVVSSEIFRALDKHLWTLAFKWAVFSHSNKPTRWVVDRYFGQFNKSRRDRWVFDDRDSGAYLNKFAWTRIYRHRMVRGTASPDDPALAEYWAERRRKTPLLPIGNTSLRLYEAQHGRCPLCKGPLLPDEDLPQSPREWEHWQTTTRKTIITIQMRADGTSDQIQPRLAHHRCHQRHAATGNGPALLSAHDPSGLA